MSTSTMDPLPTVPGGGDPNLDRDSDVPISTQIYWQLAYKIESGRLQPGERLWPVRELGAALRVNPNTIRAVYRRLSDNGYVASRHGAGTVVADRTSHRRRPEALGGIVSEMLRRAAQAGFTPDERKRPGEHVHVLFAECTTADAGYDAERLNREFTGQIEAEGTLLDEIPDRLDKFHYDLVATTTFHADEAQALVGGRVPVVAMLVGPGYVELVHEIAALPEGSRVGVVCASDRGTDNIAETLAIAGAKGIEVVSATIADSERLTLVDRTADIILMSREAIAQKLDQELQRPERIRQWSYEFDPAGLELLRRAVERASSARRGSAASGSGAGTEAGSDAESNPELAAV
jgi:GntR family transcriptional regulator